MPPQLRGLRRKPTRCATIAAPATPAAVKGYIDAVAATAGGAK
jgi:hypothetical protein